MASEEQPKILEGGVSVTASVDTNDALLITAVNYYFDIINEHSIELINNITDNYVENNTAIQDHIAQNPLIINVRGLSGEKVFTYEPAVAQQLLEEVKIQAGRAGTIQADSFWELVGLGSYSKELNKLSAISAIYPPVSNYMQLAIGAATLIDASVNKYKNIYDSVFGKKNNIGIQTDERLREIYNSLSQLRANNTALVVSTPYGIFSDMYIQSVRMTQGNELYITDIELTLKQLRFSDVTTTEADKEVLAKYNAWAQAYVQNNGKAQGNQTILKTMTDKYGYTQAGSGFRQ